MGRDLLEDFNSPQYGDFLNTIFSFGAIPAKTFNIVNGLDVKLKILSPIENIEVGKKIDSVERKGIFVFKSWRGFGQDLVGISPIAGEDFISPPVANVHFA